jgi:branched-subunit amino acid transport protein
VSQGWQVVLLLGALSYACKAAGPVLLGNRPLPEWLGSLVVLLPAALLSALVATSTFASDRSLVVDARAAGLVAAGLACWRRANFVVVVVVAAAATALARAVGLS